MRGVGRKGKGARRGRSAAHLNGVDIVSNDHKGSLLSLNEGSDVVDAILDRHGLGTLVGLVGLGHIGGSSLQTELLLCGGLGLVLVGQAEDLSGGVL